MRAKAHSEQEVIEKIIECMGEMRKEWREFVSTLAEYADKLKTDVEKEDIDTATTTFSQLKLVIRNRSTESGRLGDKMSYWKKELTKIRSEQEKQ